MSVKNLFEKKTLKPISNKSIDDLKNDAESADFLREREISDSRFLPRINFSNLENFVVYGSAEEYSKNAMKNIYDLFPYDGSRYEVAAWENSSSVYDLHLFENKYPRNNGYAILGKNYSRTGSPQSNYYNTTSPEYIKFFGGPHTFFSSSTESIVEYYDKSNKHDSKKNRVSNLMFTGRDGVNLEFWLKKDAFSSGAESNKQTIIDIRNGKTFGQNDYLRFRLDIFPNVSGKEKKFVAEIMSGSTGNFHIEIGGEDTILDNQWHHYSLDVRNLGSNLECKLFRDGVIKQTVVTGSSVGNFDGFMLGHIGSLATSVSGTYGASQWGKLSGSLDEIRFWKTSRTNEQIGRNWNTNVFGGTNTDKNVNADLGLYYKFNEGIYSTTTADSRDTKVLDYSGRITNGTWTGYTKDSRSRSSALVESGKITKEYKDPVIYSDHPDVTALGIDLKQSGSLYDQQNNSSLFSSFPEWIREDDTGQNGLKYLSQIMSNYFDNLFMQISALPNIRAVEYPSGSEQGYNFTKEILREKGLTVGDMFVDASIMESVYSRSETTVFDEKVRNVKNLIYQNLYTNLDYILKSKGTQKSLRNVLRCYGVDEELVKLNTYSDNSTYEVRDNYRTIESEKRYLDFNDKTRNDAVVYQMTSSAASGQSSYITGSLKSKDLGMTMQAEVFLPTRQEIGNPKYYFYEKDRTSLFGVVDANSAKAGDTTTPKAGAWKTVPESDLFFSIVYDKIDSPHGYFKLTSSAMGINLSSDRQEGLYNGSRWNIAARLKSVSHPHVGTVSGGDSTDYVMEFVGFDTDSDIINRSFHVTGTVTNARAKKYFKSDKRVFAGAHRQNVTGSVLNKTNALISSVRYWAHPLEDDTIKRHSIEKDNFGSFMSTNKLSLSLTSSGDISKYDSLVLAWEMYNITGSDATGNIRIDDFSSGSADHVTKYGSLGKLLFNRHPGESYGLSASSSKMVNRNVYSAVTKQPFEVVSGEEMVRVLSSDDESYTKAKTPESFYFSIEKSMYQTVSEEMLKFFSTVKDFSTLVGDPINKYRHDYKQLAKLRQMFFERVGNQPDVEKFVDYFKWIDDSVVYVLNQLLPATSDLREGPVNIVESHVLERNKYQHKYPSLEQRNTDPTTVVRGINEMTYNWKFGHAPTNGKENTNSLWWSNKALVADSYNSGVNLNSARKHLVEKLQNSKENQLKTVARLEVFRDENLDTSNNNTEYVKNETNFSSGGYLLIESGSLGEKKDSIDVVNPSAKFKYNFKVKKA